MGGAEAGRKRRRRWWAVPIAARLLTVAPERLGETAAKLAMLGWVCGMAYYNWLATYPLTVPWWAHLILMTGGLYGVSVTIGDLAQQDMMIVGLGNNRRPKSDNVEIRSAVVVKARIQRSLEPKHASIGQIAKRNELLRCERVRRRQRDDHLFLMKHPQRKPFHIAVQAD